VKNGKCKRSNLLTHSFIYNNKWAVVHNQLPINLYKSLTLLRSHWFRWFVTLVILLSNSSIHLNWSYLKSDKMLFSSSFQQYSDLGFLSATPIRKFQIFQWFLSLSYFCEPENCLAVTLKDRRPFGIVIIQTRSPPLLQCLLSTFLFVIYCQRNSQSFPFVFHTNYS